MKEPAENKIEQKQPGNVIERPGPDYTMRIDYMWHDEICTVIFVDFAHEQIAIQNYTDDLLFRAFGVVEEPAWEDFDYFLRSRCFPGSRGYAKQILRALKIDFYDPLQIVEATDGKMAEDNMHMVFHTFPRGETYHANDQINH